MIAGRRRDRFQTPTFAALPDVNENSPMSVRVRFAPSPTGPLHIGGVRTALYNYLFARKHGGTFILRIEDTDRTRYVPGAEAYIQEALQWLGLTYDEGPDKAGPHGPYRQSERTAIYRRYADQLVAAGHAYYAFDTPEELEAMRTRMKKAGAAAPKYDQVTRQYMRNSLTLPENETRELIEQGVPYVIRLKTPRQEEVKFQDEVRGWVKFQSGQLDDKVLLKADGFPTYHLANVVDDHLMDISHVIRGEEWLSSTPVHVLLYRYLGWEPPCFAHLPLILKPSGKGKLSKRDGDLGGFPVFPIEWKDPRTGEVYAGYRESGYLPEAVLNILALLGWSPGAGREILSLDEMTRLFSLEKVGKSGAKFDPQKARWINQQHLKRKSGQALAPYLRTELEKLGIDGYDDAYLAAVAELTREKAQLLTDLWPLSRFFFIAPVEYPLDVVKKKWRPEVRDFLASLAERLPDGPSSAETLETAFEEAAQALGVKAGRMKQLFRIAISGQPSGPSLFPAAALLGGGELKKRLRTFLTWAEQHLEE